MRVFALELARFLRTTWSKVWRWTFRRPLNVLVTFAVLIVLVVGIVVAVRPATSPTVAEPEPTPTPTATPVPMVEVTATPLNGGDVADDGDGEPTPSSGDDTDATGDVDAIDTADPEAVARAWATAYFTREEPSDETWADVVGPLSTDDLMTELASMAFLEGTPLDGAQQTTVTDLAIEPRDPSTEASTPIRWSRTLVVTVTDGEGTETTLSYSTVLYLADDVWTLTSVQLLGIG